jgi:membrane associated rhomboid family serine protease
MIIPYGHERSVRGLPWATMGIFVLCFLASGLTFGPDHRSAQEAGRIFSEIDRLYERNPFLELDSTTEALLLRKREVDENQREVYLDTVRESAAARVRQADAAQQAKLDALVAEYWEVYRSSISYRFGVVPRDISGLSLVTYQFLHAGWMHLLGNLLFLWLAAPHVEERWGPILFAPFYLLSGIVSALFWAVRYPHLDMPLVGASGAIAGVMGAYLICFGTSKIKFFYWFGIIWGTFEAPAWLMLPIWLVIEVISGRSVDVAAQGSGGVAHWAHVWGFIFGAAFAAVVSRFEGGRASGDVATAPEADPFIIEQAKEAARTGRVDDALAMLRDAVVSNPDAEGVGAGALWSIAVEQGRAEEVAPTLLAVIRRAARARDDEKVAETWRLLAGGSERAPVDPVLASRIGEILRRRHEDDLVPDLLARVELPESAAVPTAVLERLGWLAVGCEPPAVETALTSAALARDDLAPELRSELVALTVRPETASLSPAEDAPTVELVELSSPAVELRTAERLRIAEAVPLALDASTLSVNLERGQGRVKLSAIQAVAVGAIREDGQRPFLIIDLLLDSPWDGDGELRVVRLRSTTFDPRTLVDGATAMAAFTTLVSTLLDRSGADPLPDATRAQHPGQRSYFSIEAYQHEVLGVVG